MTLLNLIVLGIVIGSNNFAVALTLGALGQSRRRFRIMIVTGSFEFTVPLIGMLLGAAAAEAIGLHSNVIGATLLFGLGLITVLGGLRENQNVELIAQRVTTWSGLIILAAGLSLDNLLVGFSLGLAEAPPLAVASAIALFSVAFTWLGIHIGTESRHLRERTAKIISGILLMLLGIAGGTGIL